jgi:hypothetical protein
MHRPFVELPPGPWSSPPVIYAEYIEHDRNLHIQLFEDLGRQAGFLMST